MVWFIGGAFVVCVLFVLVDRLTDAPIQRRRVNAGTDRYRASMDDVRASQHSSIFDIRVGSGDSNDPLAKRLPIDERPRHDRPT